MTYYDHYAAEVRHMSMTPQEAIRQRLDSEGYQGVTIDNVSGQVGTYVGLRFGVMQWGQFRGFVDLTYSDMMTAPSYSDMMTAPSCYDPAAFVIEKFGNLLYRSKQCELA